MPRRRLIAKVEDLDAGFKCRKIDQFIAINGIECVAQFKDRAT